MKTNKIMMFVAVATMLFAACGKDEEKTDGATEAAANTLVINGKTYQLESHYAVSMSGRGYADGHSTDVNTEGAPLYSVRADVELGSANVSIDLTKSYDDVEYAFGVSNTDNTFYVCQDDHSDTDAYGSINEDLYEESIFTSGTLTVSKTDDLFTYKVTGTLKNGDAISFHLSIPASEWEQLEW